MNGIYRKINNTLYLFVAGKLEKNEWSLVFIRNSDFLTDFSQQLLQSCIQINFVTTIFLSIFLILLLKGLNRPFAELNSVANKIAKGNYDMRVNFERRDEIGEFAEHFNAMAEAIEEHIQILQQSNEEKECFINNLTHELKTPLAAVKGYSELLLVANCSAEEKEMARGYIYDHALRLEKLIQKLIEILYLKKEKLMVKSTSVSELIQSTIHLKRNALEKKGIKVEMLIEMPIIYCDEILIQTALINIIENAIFALDDKGKIMIKSYVSNQCLILEVRDTGKGIPKNEINKITEAFYRIDKSRSRASGGIGLGLSICKQIMGLHGGNVEIESELYKYTSVKLKFTTNLQPDV